MPTVSVIDLSNDEILESFELNDNEVLYDGIERCGKSLPHGCLSGSCGSCKIVVKEGAENLKSPSYVEQNTIESITESLSKKYGPEWLEGKVIRLSCRAKVQGNIKFSPVK